VTLFSALLKLDVPQVVAASQILGPPKSRHRCRAIRIYPALLGQRRLDSCFTLRRIDPVLIQGTTCGTAYEHRPSLTSKIDNTKPIAAALNYANTVTKTAIPSCAGHDPTNNPHNHKLGGAYAISAGWDFNLTSGALPTGSLIGGSKMSSFNDARTVSCLIGTKSVWAAPRDRPEDSAPGTATALAEASGQHRWYRTFRKLKASETGLE